MIYFLDNSICIYNVLWSHLSLLSLVPDYFWLLSSSQPLFLASIYSHTCVCACVCECVCVSFSALDIILYTIHNSLPGIMSFTTGLRSERSIRRRLDYWEIQLDYWVLPVSPYVIKVITGDNRGPWNDSANSVHSSIPFIYVCWKSTRFPTQQSSLPLCCLEFVFVSSSLGLERW